MGAVIVGEAEALNAVVGATIVTHTWGDKGGQGGTAVTGERR